MVADCPLHIEVELAVTLGTVFTVTVEVDVFVQPLLVPVTVYMVVDVGLTVSAAVDAPVFQEQLVAPLAVTVADCPLHIVCEVELTFGEALIVIVLEIGELLPEEFVETKVTVYVPAELQETVGFCVVEDAGVPPLIVQFHDVGLFVELSVRLIDCPAQEDEIVEKAAAGGLPAEAK